ncbi:mitochondrial glyco protein [Rozella allomycis CSF55]|uniref:Mitochondrial glyco protein n=1 Tax=Rozella allomycis (strain CSF55) TaxID=988480 RepID=A0A4P9YJI5_ROZAC|nr:mitochondrial glyco protein [Rozella allomycis CSF55]
MNRQSVMRMTKLGSGSLCNALRAMSKPASLFRVCNVRSYSSGNATRPVDKAANNELKRVLMEEIKYEMENKEDTLGSLSIDEFRAGKLPSEVQEFLKETGLSVEHKLGSSLVSFKKETDSEIITMNIDIENLYDHMEEEYEETESDLEQDNYFTTQVTIEKKSGGLKALFELEVYTDSVSLASVSFSNNDKDAFRGPDLSQLDQQLVDGMLNFLSSRGIDSELYGLFYNMARAKESSEYLNWLSTWKKLFKPSISNYVCINGIPNPNPVHNSKMDLPDRDCHRNDFAAFLNLGVINIISVKFRGAPEFAIKQPTMSKIALEVPVIMLWIIIIT